MIIDYHPDFIENNVYIELKGYSYKGVAEKTKYILASNIPYKIFYTSDLRSIFKYVYAKIGHKQIHKLYQLAAII